MNKFLSNFFSSDKIDKVGHRIMMSIYAAALIFTIGAGCFTIKLYKDNKQPTYNYEIYMKDVKSAYYVSEAYLIYEVDKYIKTIAPTSGVNARAFVEQCDKYDFDIKLALAQAHKESHFGTKGVASKTNSIFNIGAYDGLSAEQLLKKRRGYKHPDFSIEPYIKHLIKNYLVNGKTEQDLLVKYVDKYGHRYASAKDYESSLLKIYNNIDSIADIKQAYSVYHKYKILMNN